MRRRIAAILLLVFLLLSAGGCKLETGKLFQSDKDNGPELMRVSIIFTDGKTLTGYVENLGMEGSSKVYTGGSSVNYLYDQAGQIIGCFNYQRVLYMKIMSENEKN